MVIIFTSINGHLNLYVQEEMVALLRLYNFSIQEYFSLLSFFAKTHLI